MLDSILELITQATSSSTFIFCFCNLIIVIILLDLKPRISVHQRSQIHLSIGETQKQETNIKFSSEKSVESLTQEKEVSHVIEAVEAEVEEEEEAEDKIENEGNDDIDCNNEEGKEEMEKDVEEENDDELRKRVEEFIEKVNKKWKEELLSTSSLVYERKNNEIFAI